MALRKTEFRCRLTVDWIHWIILQVINTFGRFLYINSAKWIFYINVTPCLSLFNARKWRVSFDIITTHFVLDHIAMEVFFGEFQDVK